MTEDEWPNIPLIDATMNNSQQKQAAPSDNVSQFPGSAKNKAGATSENKTKEEREDKLIEYYISHLNLMVNWGSYNEFLEAKEVIKMAQIKSHMDASKHTRINEVRALWDKLVKILRKTRSALDVESWFKAVNNEISDSKARNNQNALKCPIISWSDVTSDGKAKSKILCAIIALRSLLEEKKFQLRNDVWKSYSVITDEKGVEQYQSRQTDSILREWRNYVYERKTTMYSMDVIKDAYHQIAK